MKNILYTIILSFLFSSAYALDLNRSNKEFEKRQEENTKKLEDALQLAEKCQDYICGKWRLSAEGFSATLIFYPTPNSDWEYEGIVFDNGNAGRFGFSEGDTVSHYNKLTENEYIGEDILRNFFRVFGWMPTTVYLKNINTMTRINTPPSGIRVRVVGTVQTGVRLGKKKLITENGSPNLSKNKLPTTGSGFFITKSGHIITNQHVVNKCSNIKIVKRGIESNAVLVAADPINDLAILKTTGNISDVASFRSGKGIRVGEDIIAIGYPLILALGNNIKATVGNVSALTGMNSNVTTMQITAPIQPGNSGGPLLDTSGNVVGIVSSKLNEVVMAQETGSISQNVNFAIKSSTVQTFLDVNRIDYEVKESKDKVETADIVEISEKFTTPIQCFH